MIKITRMKEKSESGSSFPDTRWGLILEVKEGSDTRRRAALEELCRIYWMPLYAFARQKGYSSADAEDLTQEFLANILRREDLNRVEEGAGKLRSFLLKAFCNFMTSEWRRETRLKRGGGQVPISIQESEAEHRYSALPSNDVTPEVLYDRAWALSLLESVLTDLESDYREKGKAETFDVLRPFLTASGAEPSHDEVASRLGMTVGAVKTMVHRLRKHYRDAICEAVGDTLACHSDTREEILALQNALRG